MGLQQLAAVFLPSVATAREAPCAWGRHQWLAPEESLRSARTGYRFAYCRYCPASWALEPIAAASEPLAIARWSPLGYAAG